MIKGRILLFLIALIPSFGAAQILNDSTKLVYGPQSTGFLYESDILAGDTTLHHPDTLINGFHFMTLNKSNGWLWQDLGNEGTAARNHVFKTADNAFTETGWTAFSQFYAPKKSEIKYYNTRSPYTNLSYVQNAKGMTNLGLTHAQNINPQWNIALNVNRILSVKQFSANTSEDRLVDHWDYTLSTNYKSKNERYQFAGALIHFNHLQNEQGGISIFEGDSLIPASAIRGDYNTNYQQLLQGVKSRERWNDIRFLHQLRLSKGIELFHEFDFQHHKYFHSDTLVAINNQFGIYPDTVSAEKMKNYFFFHNIQNRIGFKGYFKGFKYNVGITNRIYGLDAVHADKKSTRTEVLIGGNAGYWFTDSSSYLNNEVYFGVGNSVNIFLNSTLKVKNYNLGFKFVSKPSGLFYNNFTTNLVAWQNNFSNVNTTSAYASTHVKLGKISFEPAIHLHWIDNYLYFGQDQTPKQLVGQAIIFNADVNASIQLKNWRFSNRIILNTTTNTEVFRFPAIMDNLNIEYHVFYAKVLDMYFGTDIYYRSSFKGMAYSPLLQSFYLQDKQSILGYPVADVYTNFMIKRVKLGFGFNYLNKGLGTAGFYTTPQYLAMGRAFYLKVNWPLFD